MTKETVEKYVQAMDGKSLATVRGGKNCCYDESRGGHLPYLHSAR